MDMKNQTYKPKIDLGKDQSVLEKAKIWECDSQASQLFFAFCLLSTDARLAKFCFVVKCQTTTKLSIDMKN